MTRLNLSKTMLIRLLAFALLPVYAFAELPINYPEWLEEVPGNPENNQDLFYKYALGRAPENTEEPLDASEEPYFLIENGSAFLKLNFMGRQDVVYIFEGRTELGADSEWESLVWKLGPTPWQAVPNEDIELLTTESGLQFTFINADNQYYRLRVETDVTLGNAAQASRFLKQATFGPKRGEINDLLDIDLDFEGWIDAQFAMDPTTHTGHAKTIKGYANYPDSYPLGGNNGSGEAKCTLWFDAAINAPDQLRQRVAWALFQIIVMGENNSQNSAYLDEWIHYYDFYVTHATKTYRELLQVVTESPKMGRYLTYVNNRAETNTTKPDENYAREVMQLFTIGLWELNLDGTVKLDEDQEPIPTYDNSDVQELAKVFTGFQYAADNPNYQDTDQNWIDPMRRNNGRHDKTRKTLVEGTVLPANQSLIQDVNQALDALFNHPNTAPFISKRLILRLTCSNPSPQYVERVATVFEDDGNGVRGDIAAVVKAILLDPEARSGAFIVDPTRGKLREPLLKFTQYCRTFSLTTQRLDGVLYITNLEDYLGAFPYNSPTVFNFYYTDFSPAGDIRDQNLVAPEFQILDDSTGIRTFQVMKTLVDKGLVTPIGQNNNSQGALNFDYEEGIAADATALVDHLNLLLTNDSLSEEERTAILTAVEAIPSNENNYLTKRVKRALTLFSIAPSFNVLR